jgi:N-carbamoyl-L-amino-acid hydrolase
MRVSTVRSDMTLRLTVDRERLVETMRSQAEIGGTDDGGLDRVALTPADGEVRDWFCGAMRDAGLSVRVDEVGNVFGRREGTDPDAAPVLLGSHLDSQPDGGVYDGALGVVAALEFVRELDARDIRTRRPVEVVDWTNEEGTRFQPAAAASGSRVWAGEATPEEAYDTTDADGVRFEDALEAIGYRSDVPAEPPEPYHAHLELHVEQGPRLAERGADVGVVTGVVSRSWGAVTFEGEPDHSGTTPMDRRHDAAVAAADTIVELRRIAGTVGEKTVATTGSVDLSPNSINVVPGEATLTWDIRDPSDATVETARERVLAAAAAAAEREGVDWSYQDRNRTDRVEFDERPVESVRAAVTELGYDGPELISYAGHDAPHLSRVCDVGMVFAVSENGVSHSPEEFTTWEHCHRAANVFATAALQLAEHGDA